MAAVPLPRGGLGGQELPGAGVIAGLRDGYGKARPNQTLLQPNRRLTRDVDVPRVDPIAITLQATKFDLDFPAKGCLAQVRRGRRGRVEASRNRSGHLDLG